MTLPRPKEAGGGWVHQPHSGSGSDLPERSAPSVLQLQDLVVCGRNTVKLARAFISMKTQLPEAAPAEGIGRRRFKPPSRTVRAKQQIRSIILPNTLGYLSCPDLHADLRPERLTCWVSVSGLPCLPDAAGLGRWEAFSRDVRLRKEELGVPHAGPGGGSGSLLLRPRPRLRSAAYLSPHFSDVSISTLTRWGLEQAIANLRVQTRAYWFPSSPPTLLQTAPASHWLPRLLWSKLSPCCRHPGQHQRRG